MAAQHTSTPPKAPSASPAPRPKPKGKERTDPDRPRHMGRARALQEALKTCEERGSGIDKVVAQIEIYQLPPPLFEVPPAFTRVVLFAPRPLVEMDKDERVRACYWHACLKYVQREVVTNTTIRDRFGIEEQNRAMASRLIRDAVDAGVIVPRDPGAAPRHMQYLPWWAASTRRESP